jgi:hypothetical protein
VTHATEDVTLGNASVRVQLTQAAAAPDSVARAVQPLVATAPRLQKRTLLGTPPMAMSAAPKAVGAAAPSAAPAIPAPAPGQHTFLVVSDLSATIQPGVIYSVYLEAPRAGGSPQLYRIGSLNFFSAMAHGMGIGQRKVSFDITELATQLAKEKRLSSTPAVVFVPNGQPPSQAQPLIGSVSLVIQ